MVHADDEHTDSTEPASDTNKKERESGRLTPMPDWLMKWWIPLAIAGTLFLLSMLITSIWGTATYEEIVNAIQHFPKRWPFHMRTPSREEIEVCLTITGAGLAFSAWQQRSHDNVVKEKQEQATIERDDYWKRREHIFQLLGSKNPGLRLGAVALLAELADTAAHSPLLNDTEKQQLQRHIIDTLCLQVRHEGLCIEEEGDKREHRTIQHSILMSIFQRINHPQQDDPIANWSESIIGLNDCTILTPVSIRSIITNSTLDLRGTSFEEKLEISESIIKNILWETTYFKSGLNVTRYSDIGMQHPPTFGGRIKFQNTIIRPASRRNRFIIFLQPNQQKSHISFDHCRFYDTSCKCYGDCECRTSTQSTTCQCKIQNFCTCGNICINTDLCIRTATISQKEETNYPDVTIQNCKIGRLRLQPSQLGPRITIRSNIIHELIELIVGFQMPAGTVRTYTHYKDQLIILENNTIQIPSIPRTPPLLFQPDTHPNIRDLISFKKISIRLTTNRMRRSEVIFSNNALPCNSFHFTTLSAHDHQDSLQFSWDTGSLSSTYHKALACSIKEREHIFKVQSAKIQHLDFVTQAYDTTRKFMSEYAMEADWPDDHFSATCAAEDIEHSNCYIVYNGDIPYAAFVLNPGSDANNPDKVVNWRSNIDHYVIQRISPVNGEGVAHSIFNYAARRANYLRCLTHERNSILRHALEIFGFKECGTFVAEDGSTRIAYDWIKAPDPQD